MKRLFILAIFIIVQIFAAITAGYAALELSAPENAAGGGSVCPEIAFSGMDVSKASSLIETVSENQLKNGMAGFLYQDREYLFKYSEIGLTADYSGLEDVLRAKSKPAYAYNLFSAFRRNYGEIGGPVYSADSALFLKKLSQIKSGIDAPPVNADINCDAEGRLTAEPSFNGVELNLDDQSGYILDSFLENPFKPFALDSEAMLSSSALIVREPRVTGDLLSGVNAALSNVNITIPDGYDVKAIENAAGAVSKIWLPKKGMAYAPFSYLHYLSEAGLSPDGAPRESEFVATVLVHSLLIGGGEYAKMEYARRDDTTIYPDLPGFGVDLSAGGDFKFTNGLEGNIVIFTFVEDGGLRVIVAGNEKFFGRNAAPYKIYSETDENGRASLYRNGKKIAS